MLSYIIITLVLFFSGSNIEKKINDYLKNQLKNYTKFEYSIVSLPRSIRMNNNSFYVAADKGFKFNNGYGYVPVYIKTRGNKTKESVITVKLKLYKDVLIANQDIKAGTKLKSTMFNIKTQNVVKLFSKPLTDINGLADYEVKRKIKKGSILQEDMVKDIPVVELGNPVIAYKIVGNVEISFKAKARNSGRKGDKIFVAANKRIFKGVVVNKNYVKIIE